MRLNTIRHTSKHVDFFLQRSNTFHHFSATFRQLSHIPKHSNAFHYLCHILNIPLYSTRIRRIPKHSNTFYHLFQHITFYHTLLNSKIWSAFSKTFHHFPQPSPSWRYLQTLRGFKTFLHFQPHSKSFHHILSISTIFHFNVFHHNPKSSNVFQIILARSTTLHFFTISYTISHLVTRSDTIRHILEHSITFPHFPSLYKTVPSNSITVSNIALFSTTFQNFPQLFTTFFQNFPQLHTPLGGSPLHF